MLCDSFDLLYVLCMSDCWTVGMYLACYSNSRLDENDEIWHMIRWFFFGPLAWVEHFKGESDRERERERARKSILSYGHWVTVSVRNLETLEETEWMREERFTFTYVESSILNAIAERKSTATDCSLNVDCAQCCRRYGYEWMNIVHLNAHSLKLSSVKFRLCTQLRMRHPASDARAHCTL